MTANERGFSARKDRMRRMKGGLNRKVGKKPDDIMMMLG
jgi:hypothetical protein